MPEGIGPEQMLAFWQSGQEAFWTAAADGHVFEDASSFAEPDWQVFDGLAGQLLGQAAEQTGGRTLPDGYAAAARYRDVIARTFSRIRKGFEIQRRALKGTGAALDWRVLRERWFSIAEAEFIRTLRSDAFISAQRDVIRAGLALWHEMPPQVRTAAIEQRHLAATARQTMAHLGAGFVEIAATPKDLLWRNGKVTLWRYRPLGPRIEGLPPIVICHGLIGRQTMTDLRPDRSMVRNLLAAGADLLVVDWGNADSTDQTRGMDHYVGEMLPQIVAHAREATGAAEVVLFGICQGGTMVACHAALKPEGLAGLITAVAPFDFHADVHDADPAHGLLHLWTRSLEPKDIDALIGMEGNLSGELMGLVFHQLNPVRTLARYAIEMIEPSADPGALTTFIAMENWLADRPDLPGALARDWLVGLYRENRLANGALVVQGQPVDLGALRLPVLNVFATADHIIPPPCSRALGKLAPAARYQELALPSGHVGTFVSARSQSLLAPQIMQWLTG